MTKKIKPETNLLAQVGEAKVVQVRRKGKKSISWDYDPEVLFRLEQVSQMVLHGAKAWQIAESLGTSIKTAQRDRARVRELWGREASGAVNEHRERAIAHFRHLQTIAWEKFSKDKDHQLLRLIGDWENDISKLQGTEKSVDQTVNVNTNERPYKFLSDSELHALLTARKETKGKRDRGGDRTRTSDS